MRLLGLQYLSSFKSRHHTHSPWQKILVERKWRYFHDRAYDLIRGIYNDTESQNCKLNNCLIRRFFVSDNSTILINSQVERILKNSIRKMQSVNCDFQ